jgi:2-polyprenyl-3-methyl-5-hydroxy-6-metoxy-1,4-benzoquinol methylase
MSVAASIDSAKQDAFVGQVLANTSGAMVTTLAALGDRLGLFKTLAASGPATSAEIAARAGIVERYAREWLGGMMSAGYLTYDPATRRFALPPEHVAALADEGGPMFFGGVYEMLLSASSVVDRVAEAFRAGGGVPQSAYDDRFWDGMERFSGGWYDNLLVQQWLPAMPDVQRKLRDGADVADVGCGRGRALIRLAQAYAASRYVGYDAFAPSIERATAHASKARVTDRVRYEVRDAASDLPGRFDVITTFDVIHDAVDPVAVLRSIFRALKPDGIYACLEPNCSDKLEENTGPIGSIFHGISILYCMTTSLAGGGTGLGTLGLHEHKLRDLATVIGFRDVRRVPIKDPFNNLYELRR